MTRTITKATAEAATKALEELDRVRRRSRQPEGAARRDLELRMSEDAVLLNVRVFFAFARAGRLVMNAPTDLPDEGSAPAVRIAGTSASTGDPDPEPEPLTTRCYLTAEVAPTTESAASIRLPVGKRARSLTCLCTITATNGPIPAQLRHTACCR